MSDFIISLLDLCMYPFTYTSNLIFFVPTGCLVVIFLFSLIRLLMGKGRVRRW